MLGGFVIHGYADFFDKEIIERIFLCWSSHVLEITISCYERLTFDSPQQLLWWWCNKILVKMVADGTPFLVQPRAPSISVALSSGNAMLRELCARSNMQGTLCNIYVCSLFKKQSYDQCMMYDEYHWCDWCNLQFVHYVVLSANCAKKNWSLSTCVQ